MKPPPCHVIILCLCHLERHLAVVVGDGSYGNVHPYLNLLRFGRDACEQLGTVTEIDNAHGIGAVFLETERRIVGSGKGLNLTLLGYLKPVHVLGKTGCAVGARWKILGPALLTYRSFYLPSWRRSTNFAVFVMPVKLFLPNFSKPILSPPEYCNVSVEPYAANVVHKADIRIPWNLHRTRLAAKLKNDGTNLRSTRGSNGMTF